MTPKPLPAPAATTAPVGPQAKGDWFRLWWVVRPLPRSQWLLAGGETLDAERAATDRWRKDNP